MMQVGDKVIWNQKHPGIVLGTLGDAKQRVQIALYSEVREQNMETVVWASSLEPRTNTCIVDEAYTAQKEAQPPC